LAQPNGTDHFIVDDVGIIDTLPPGQIAARAIIPFASELDHRAVSQTSLHIFHCVWLC
jgi:hypothetical protein